MSNTHGGWKAVGVAVLLVVLTGCGGSSSDSTAQPDASASGSSPSSSSSAPGSETPSSEPSPSESPATVQQYASIVARNADLKKQIRIMDDCDWLGDGMLDTDPQAFECQFGVLTMSYGSKTLALSLQNASDQGSPDYIGPAPAELTSLVDETVTKAQTLGQLAAKADNRGCVDSGRGECGQIRGDTWQAMNSVTDVLRAWDPYL